MGLLSGKHALDLPVAYFAHWSCVRALAWHSKGYEPTSTKIGDLEAGTRCTTYDTVSENGIERARVVVESGPLKGKEGWVMFVTKSGERRLIDERGIAAFARLLPKSAIEAARAAFSSIDVDSSGSLSKQELKEVLTREGGMSEAELEDIIATFDVNGNGELSFAEVCAAVGAALWVVDTLADRLAFESRCAISRIYSLR